MQNRTIRYFGYGSLVNRDTRPSTEMAQAATLLGWQRAWAHRVLASETDRGACSSLTIEKLRANSKPNQGIQGVLVTMPEAELPLLDEREAGYDRVQLSVSDFELETPTNNDPIYVYVSNSQHNVDADDQHPVLQSYVDCVMAGFLKQYGESGLQAFVQSTRGWQLPIANDRLNPRYPRAVVVDDGQCENFDALVTQQCLRESGNI